MVPCHRVLGKSGALTGYHWGITRKHAMPLIAELDARGITRRRGDMRIAGPRL